MFEYIDDAKKVFDIEIRALELLKDSLNDDFGKIINIITNCNGKVVFTGIGKSGHIAQKIAATMSSLGTSSFFLHPAEALHGDLGMVSSNDVVIAISYSGESEEITRLLPSIKTIGAMVIAISGNKDSTLVKYSDLSQIFPKFDEACYLKLAPTSSTTAALVYGDALAIIASKIYGFTEENFGLMHPAGALGRKLFMKVSDLMVYGKNNSVSFLGASLKSAIIEISTKGLGMVTIVNKNGVLKGVITDGDLRRQLEKSVNIYNLSVDDVMTTSPICIKSDAMAIEALKVCKDRNITGMPIIDDEKKVVGVIKLQSILKAGIIL